MICSNKKRDSFERFLREVIGNLSNGDSGYDESLSLPSLEDSLSPSLPSLVETPSLAAYNERLLNRRGRENFQVVEVDRDVDMDSDLSNGDSEFKDMDSNETLREGTGMVTFRVEPVMTPGPGMSDLDGQFGVLAFLMHTIAISHDSPDDDSI